ncbi:TetR family transcriptional regulator [Epidermidibacterium keratini]|uniref:TetR family transcriptional regulator n=1 Tax=Epidermidibacterium keratini TaxID=1891644 RepID=A0A7L4YH87_9ACTN|nr:TetR/AcrR family transcriptional regulator [Epidermidibacterium keratini]QHB98970.1 TetR family transcriptional regulator [Epidermidibacterium keratini]
MDDTGRRAEIVDAAARLFERGGIEAITMRAVAQEAGVSLRLVQYYGSSKDELLVAVLEQHSSTSLRRWKARLSRRSAERSLPDVLRTFLRTALPTDSASRALHRVGTSIELLAITDGGAVAAAYERHLDELADVLSGALTSAEPQLDAEHARQLALEAMAMAHGMGTLLLLHRLGRQQAEESIDRFAQNAALSDEHGPRQTDKSPRPLTS